ncbi:flagellar filament capping protein FliD [Acidovorax sp. DW039]|uniref:flagellar filament capping protein FliD n=1 Tax=Acidovorax sp. DW039 TaxID=3095606 RepID=UPI00308776D5|nr:flagellar filament capping protein FliD [Acidovorax sp. DW039]
MATFSSVGVGTGGLDSAALIKKMVDLEREPLAKLETQKAIVTTKISAFGQMKSLVSALSDAASKLTSVTGWNAVSTNSSDSKYVSATAVGGTLPTTFSVAVQSLAKAQSTASAALMPLGAAVGAGTVRLEVGRWSGTPESFTPGAGKAPVDIEVSASDKLSDIASKINGSGAGVTASILSDASGERLLLRSKVTGEEAGFRLSVMEGGDTDIGSAANTDASGLSRLVNGSTVTQSAADAKATVNGIAVSSGTNSFANTVSGVTFTAVQVTASPVEISVAKDTSAVSSNIDAFVSAYNAINQLINEATKFDTTTGKGALLQGDSTTIALQSALRSAVQSVTTGSSVFQRLADVGITQQRGGDLAVDKTKLAKAMNDNMEELKNMFRSTEGGSAEGIAVKIKATTTSLLSGDGFFKSKDNSLQLALKRNEADRVRGEARVDAFEKRLNARYSALDTQMSKLTALNAYVAQQVTTWNKSSG